MERPDETSPLDPPPAGLRWRETNEVDVRVIKRGGYGGWRNSLLVFATTVSAGFLPYFLCSGGHTFDAKEVQKKVRSNYLCLSLPRSSLCTFAFRE
jgi:hypothetical protein